MERDPTSGVGAVIREVGLDGSRERELRLVDELQHHERGHPLRDRAELVARVQTRRHARLDVLEAIRFGEEHAVAAGDEDDAVERGPLGEAVHDLSIVLLG